MTRRSTRTRTRVVSTVTLAFLCVAAAACSSDSGSAKSRDARSTTSSSTTTGSRPDTGSTGATKPTGIASNVLAPVGIGQRAPLAENVFVTVTSVDPVKLEAHGPGETAGAGVVATVQVRNETGQPFDLNKIAINAHYGDGTPASPNTAPPAKRLDGLLAPGREATGKYAFRVPSGGDGSVVIDVQQSASPNVVIVDVRA
jgi:hypothetical protein